MNIRHNALVLVADGQKYLLLRNTGDFKAPKLKVEARDEREGNANRDLAADAPGRRFDNGLGPMRSSMEQTDYQQMAEDAFVAEAAAMLDQHVTADDCPQVIVVAPPRALAELRRTYSRDVRERLTDEVDKTLTGHPIDEIAALLTR
jgi:protein required for attachment to host cells